MKDRKTGYQDYLDGVGYTVGKSANWKQGWNEALLDNRAESAIYLWARG